MSIYLCSHVYHQRYKIKYQYFEVKWLIDSYYIKGVVDSLIFVLYMHFKLNPRRVYDDMGLHKLLIIMCLFTVTHYIYTTFKAVNGPLQM